MPGRRRRAAPTPVPDPVDPNLPGFQAEHHGQRSELEEIAGAGGGVGGAGGGAGPSPAAAPPPTATPLVPQSPLYGPDGSIIPGRQDIPPAAFPDDPDLPLRILYSLSPHPDIAALLEPRGRESYLEGVDVGMIEGQDVQQDEDAIDPLSEFGAVPEPDPTIVPPDPDPTLGQPLPPEDGVVPAPPEPDLPPEIP